MIKCSRTIQIIRIVMPVLIDISVTIICQEPMIPCTLQIQHFECIPYSIEHLNLSTRINLSRTSFSRLA